MIVKSFEINKINNSHKIFLFYGENEGHKNEIIEDKTVWRNANRSAALETDKTKQKAEQW